MKTMKVPSYQELISHPSLWFLQSLKMLISLFQACRGSVLEVGVCETDGGTEVTDAKSQTNPLAESATVADVGTCTTVPAGADIVVCYSVVEGNLSKL